MIFVTGGTGLVGSYLLLELCLKGIKLRALKRRDSSLEVVQKLFERENKSHLWNQIQWVEGDLQDINSLKNSLKGIETVYHTAGYVSFDERNRKKLFEVNEEGTANLINICISQKVSNFIFTSSISTLDKNLQKNTISENSEWNKELIHSSYAASKRKAEMEVWRGAEEGLNVIVAYPGIIIGSLDGKRESEMIFSMAQKSKTFSTKAVTGFIDVRDVASSLIELAEKKLYKDNFILVSENKSYYEILSYLRQKTNKKPPFILSRKQLNLIRKVSLVSKFFGGAYLSKANLTALSEDSFYDNDKIKNALNQNKFIPVNEALDFHFEEFQKINR